MPGGLTDSLFAINSRASLRARNWLTSPWNVAAVNARWEGHAGVSVTQSLSFVDGARSLVWRNEEGGPGAPDAVTASGDPIGREVESERFRTLAAETRARVNHRLAGLYAVTSAGIRASRTTARRYEGGPGSVGSDFDLRLVGGDWERALRLRTTNAAAFAEELIHLTDRVSVVPGARVEMVRSTASGYTDVTSTFEPRRYRVPLAGLGLSAITSERTELYANFSQAYRPILYSSITPLGSTARIDPSLHSSRGDNSDLGWRGTLGDAMKFDVAAFRLRYRDRIGARTVTDTGGDFTEIGNIGSSDHRGVESYVEIDPWTLLGGSSPRIPLDLFSSFAFVNARYTSGHFAGNRVEQAPRTLTRIGITSGMGTLSSTLQLSHTSESFGDANNSTSATADASGGSIPGYSVVDWSVRWIARGDLHISAGANNLLNATYFTKRTSEYPGPGILPGIARSVYVGVRASAGGR